jgi:hypothetical protein
MAARDGEGGRNPEFPEADTSGRGLSNGVSLTAAGAANGSVAVVMYTTKSARHLQFALRIAF